MKKLILIFSTLLITTSLWGQGTPTNYYETEINNFPSDLGTQTVIHSSAILNGESNQNNDVWLLDHTVFTTDLYVKKVNGNALVKLFVSDNADYSNAIIVETISSSYTTIILIPSKYYYIEISQGNANGHRVQIGNVDFLPVELSSFTVRENNDAALLEWETASEENSSHFEIQKSTNGIDWISIGEVESHHNSTEKNTYTFKDNNIKNGTIYYQLKMIDFDETYEFSEVVSLSISKKQSTIINIFPNPTTDYVNIIRNTSEITPIAIHSIDGQIIYQGTLINDSSIIDLSLFESGNYFITIYYENNVETQLLTITKK